MWFYSSPPYKLTLDPKMSGELVAPLVTKRQGEPWHWLVVLQVRLLRTVYTHKHHLKVELSLV